jgi:hypothetical protein
MLKKYLITHKPQLVGWVERRETHHDSTQNSIYFDIFSKITTSLP